MRSKFFYGISGLLFLLILFSCDSTPESFSQSWFMPEKGKAGSKRGSIKLIGVSVDRSGGWDSLEKEVNALAPFYFWKYGCRLAEPGAAADYAVDISLRERELNAGWRTWRSLAVEVRIWACNDENEIYADGFSKRLPLAAGRIVAIGEESFSSSKITDKMLSHAISKSVKKLPARKGG